MVRSLVPAARSRALDEGSALLLVPLVGSVTSLLLLVIATLGSLVIAHDRLRNLAATCALDAARALSVTAWESSGALVLDPVGADVDVRQCVSRAGLGQLSWTTTTTSTTVTVAIRERVTTPLTSWLFGRPVTLAATAAATEVPRSLG